MLFYLGRLPIGRHFPNANLIAQIQWHSQHLFYFKDQVGRLRLVAGVTPTPASKSTVSGRLDAFERRQVAKFGVCRI